MTAAKLLLLLIVGVAFMPRVNAETFDAASAASSATARVAKSLDPGAPIKAVAFAGGLESTQPSIATPDVLGSTPDGFGSALRTDLQKVAVKSRHVADGWLMLLVSIALVGYQLRRKQRALNHHLTS